MTAPQSEPAGPRALLARAERLRRAQDVRAVFAARRAASSPNAVVHSRPRPESTGARATVVAGKKVGNAVARNRAKRRLRGILLQQGVPAGADYVLVARPGALTARADVLAADVGALLLAAAARR